MKLNQQLNSFIIYALTIITFARALYLPGVAPTDYNTGESVGIKVNKLDSVKTQLPYNYYHLKFCQPEVLIMAAENLGEYLSGDVIENSPYTIRIDRPRSCDILCKTTIDSEDRDNFGYMIDNEYRVNMIVDNLPAFTKQTYEINGELIDRYEKGFPLGFVGTGEIGKKGTRYLYNHLKFIIHVHRISESQRRIVGFEVEPNSVKHSYSSWNGEDTTLDVCTGKVQSQMMEMTQATEVVWTYDVVWLDSDIRWASRWDIYMKMGDSEIHWFSIINSSMVLVFLSAIVALIMTRTLRRDIARYNAVDASPEGQQEETGWKLVHGDVFRNPSYAGLLCILVGTGTQVFGMSSFVVLGAVLGFISPALRGGLITGLLILFALMGFVAGFVSNRLHGLLGLSDWKRNALQTALLFPGVNIFVFVTLNFFIRSTGSSGAVPFPELFALVGLWLGISAPLVYLGARVSEKWGPLTHPIKVNQIKRVVPEVPWYMQSWCTVLVAGALPFGAAFTELVFIMSSIWFHRIYYMFGFLLAVLFILTITCIESTIVMCYFQLCAEDYHWWWRSFFTSGSSAFYLFLYSAVYFFTKLGITDTLPTVLYFGYMILISSFFFVLTGAIGFLSTLLFVRTIYDSIKVD